MSIIPQKTEINAKTALDLIGRDFNFNHSKGIAELLKNSYDAYLNDSIPKSQQKIIVSFKIKNNDYVNEISVIDFCGMSKSKIDKGFIHWFDKKASKLNKKGSKTLVKTLGGHGNGGKFYMRQMFRESNLITYLDGKINIFGFNKNKDYGYMDGYKNKTVGVADAIKIAGINRFVSKQVMKKLDDGKCGFTIVRGTSLKKGKASSCYKMKILDELLINPQARSVIEFSNVYFQQDDNERKLTSRPIDPHPDFIDPIVINAPKSINTLDGIINVTSDNYQTPPKLILRTSSFPLKGPKYSNINRIDFVGESGVVGNYLINKLGNFSSGNTDFIYGECQVKILEDPKNNHVRNDREKLIESPLSNAIISWVIEEIEKLAFKMAEKSKNKQRKNDLKNTADLNRILNTWKNQFLKNVLIEQLFGDGQEFGVGGNTIDDFIIGSKKGKQSGKKAKKKKGETGGEKSRKASGFPEVLVSSQDPDPQFGDGRLFDCDERHHAVHQRPWDVQNNIFWINTNKPIASRIIEEYGSESPRWRNYLFQMYNDIIIKEAIELLYKKDIPSADDINNKIDEAISLMQEKAVSDLDEFLFKEDFKL